MSETEEQTLLGEARRIQRRIEDSHTSQSELDVIFDELKKMEEHYHQLLEQEEEVKQYLLQITNNQIGVGTRPISFLVASHAELRRRLGEKKRQASAEETAKLLNEFIVEYESALDKK